MLCLFRAIPSIRWVSIATFYYLYRAVGQPRRDLSSLSLCASFAWIRAVHLTPPSIVDALLMSTEREDTEFSAV